MFWRRRAVLAGGCRRSCKSPQHEKAGWPSSRLSNSGQSPATPGSREPKPVASTPRRSIVSCCLGRGCMIPYSERFSRPGDDRPAPRVDGRAFLRCLCGRLPTRHDLDVGLHVPKRAADTDARIPGAGNANGGDLDPVAAVVGLDQQSFSAGAAGSIAHSGQSL
jgi:hypothetical protein